MCSLSSNLRCFRAVFSPSHTVFTGSFHSTSQVNELLHCSSAAGGALSYLQLLLLLATVLFSLPGHFLLFTRHSLISEISGQGLPKGDGYWRTCRVRVSWPRLNPQVLPDREQGLHSLHSPTSQCTELRKTSGDEKIPCLVISLFFLFRLIQLKLLVFIFPNTS